MYIHRVNPFRVYPRYGILCMGTEASRCVARKVVDEPTCKNRVNPRKSKSSLWASSSKKLSPSLNPNLSVSRLDASRATQ